ncbi:MAG: type IV toxin-antitoxin system AbiEi family antitoxin domain-containing protein [Deferrisomatales bacterium]
MTFAQLLEISRSTPLIESQTLLAFGAEPRALAVQLGRWVKAGKLVQLRRGLYAVHERLRYRSPPAEKIANLLVTPSYVSLERALSVRGLIPEGVPVVQSVTTGRGGVRETALGTFEYRHVKRDWFFGYEELPPGEEPALVAVPEKALLDLVYLSRGPFTRQRVQELRLQDLERFDPTVLRAAAARAGSFRVERAAEVLCRWLAEELAGEVTL